MTYPTVSSKRLQRHVSHILIADSNRAGGGVVQPRDEVGQRRSYPPPTARPTRSSGRARPRRRCQSAPARWTGSPCVPLPPVTPTRCHRPLGRRTRRARTPTATHPAGSTPASGFSSTREGRSRTSKTRSKLTSAVIRSIRTFERPCMRAKQAQQERAENDQGAYGELLLDRQGPARTKDHGGGQGRYEHQRGTEQPGDQGDAHSEITNRRRLSPRRRHPRGRCGRTA